MDNPDDLLTTAEVAQIMRSPVSTLRYWRHLGTGPHSLRVGRRVVYQRGGQTPPDPGHRRPAVVPGLHSDPAQRFSTRAASALTTCRPK